MERTRANSGGIKGRKDQFHPTSAQLSFAQTTSTSYGVESEGSVARRPFHRARAATRGQ
jgi:hypothetical protein